MSGQIYDLLLPAGGVGRIPALGTTFKVVSAPAGAVLVANDLGDSWPCLAGQGASNPLKPFRDLFITNQQTAQQLVRVFVGGAEWTDARITGIVGISNVVGAANQSGSVTGGNLLLSTFNQVTIFLAAANPRGCIVRQARVGNIHATAGAATACTTALVAAPVTSALTQNPGIILAWCYNPTNVWQENGFDDKNIQIPAGWGMSAVAGNGEACTAAQAYFSYELL